MIKIAVFASGSGTNAENIARLFNEGNRIRVSLVVTNRRNAGVIARMKPLGVETVYEPNSVWDTNPQAIVDLLRSSGIDLIVLAGFMHYVSPVIINAFPGRVINIHPSLLPAYGGKGMWGHHVHEAVIAAGEKRSGVTVHYVTEEVDGGEIIMQQEVEITPADTAATLEAKIHPIEYELYPRAIARVCERLESTQATGRPTPPEVPVPPEPTQEEAWAQTLKVEFDSEEADRRRHEAEKRAEEAARRAQTAMPPQPQRNEDVPPMPPTNLVWSVLVTLFCCVAGIVAIVFSTMVSSRYYAGDYEGAVRASRRSEIWIVVSFVLGVLINTLLMPIMFFSSLL